MLKQFTCLAQKSVACTSVLSFLFSVTLSPVAQASIWETRKEHFTEMQQKKKDAAESKLAHLPPALQAPKPVQEETLLAELPDIQIESLDQNIPRAQLFSAQGISTKDPKSAIIRRVPRWLEAVPAQYASIKEFYVPEGKTGDDFMVVHIQDAHDNREAQKNIARLLGALDRKSVV